MFGDRIPVLTFSDMQNYHQKRRSFPTLQILSALFLRLLDKKCQEVKTEKHLES